MQDKIRIYLDNCCFNRPFDEQTQIRIQIETEAKLYIQEQIVSNRFELVWSYILDFENFHNPFEERKKIIFKWKKYACCDIEESKQLLLLAEEIKGYSVKSKDALHIACAISGKCRYFFTTDDILIKKMKEFKIQVMNPVEFISLIEE